MAHKHSKEECRKFIKKHIKTHLKEGMPFKQSIAVALEEARKIGCKIPKKNV